MPLDNSSFYFDNTTKKCSKKNINKDKFEKIQNSNKEFKIYISPTRENPNTFPIKTEYYDCRK
jgi:hypothetical protein